MRIYILIAYILLVVNVNAQKVMIDGLKYYLDPDNHEAIIDNGNVWTGELNIPSEVNYNGQTYIVKSISWLAFSNCTELTRVRIPKTIESVTHYILSNQDDDVPGAVSEDYMNPFVGCTSLESIEVDAENQIMKSDNGILYSKDGKKLFCYPGGKESETFIIPEDVIWIGGCAFAHNKYIISLNLHTNVEHLGAGAFQGCTELAKVNLPENLSFLSAYLFDGCSNLNSILIPACVRRLGEQVFSGCSLLRIIELPESIYSVGPKTFSGCKLDALIIRGQLDDQSVNEYLFNGLDESTKVFVPASEIARYKSLYAGETLPLEDYHNNSDGIDNSTTQPSVPYHAFVKDGKLWAYEESGRTDERIGDVTAQYYQVTKYNIRIDGDTIVGGKTYKKVYKDDISIDKELLYTSPKDAEKNMEKHVHIDANTTALYPELLREADKKVYALKATEVDNSEYVLYDFSAAAGEMVSELLPGERLYVNNVDTIYVNDIYYRRYNVVQDQNEYVKYVWVEGIGNPSYLFEPVASGINSEWSCKMTACYEDNQRIFTYNDFFVPDYTAGVSSAIQDRKREKVIYDLQGRRLAKEPAKGIYIENNKKIFKTK